MISGICSKFGQRGKEAAAGVLIEGLGLGEHRERRGSHHAFLMAPRASLSALVLKRTPQINGKKIEDCSQEQSQQSKPKMKK